MQKHRQMPVLIFEKTGNNLFRIFSNCRRPQKIFIFMHASLIVIAHIFIIYMFFTLSNFSSY